MTDFEERNATEDFNKLSGSGKGAPYDVVKDGDIGVHGEATKAFKMATDPLNKPPQGLQPQPESAPSTPPTLIDKNAIDSRTLLPHKPQNLQKRSTPGFQNGV